MFAKFGYSFFIIFSIVGGLVIGLVASTDVSPIIAGILGALVIFSLMLGINFLTRRER